MKTIYKYPVGENVQIPDGSKILKFGVQNGRMFLWALVDPNEQNIVSHNFQVVGTGWKLNDATLVEFEFVDTIFDDEFVWHIFQKKS